MTVPDDTTPPGWEDPLPCVDGHVIRRTITEITMESGSDEHEIAACLRAAWQETREDAAPLIAAELRRLADESEAAAARVLVREVISHETVVACCLRDHAARLRARADELDPVKPG